jgi:hypothetical protein
MRYVLGPRFDGVLSRPAVPGEPIDPVPHVQIDHVEAGDPGQVHVHLAVALDPYDPSTSSALLAVHAVAFAKGDGIPTDPQKVLGASKPQGSIDLTGQTSGTTADLVVHGVPEGAASILTVFVYDDAATPPASTPAAPAPAAPAAPATPAS